MRTKICVVWDFGTAVCAKQHFITSDLEDRTIVVLQVQKDIGGHSENYVNIIYIYCQEKYTKTPKKLSGENNLSMNSTPDNLTENDDLYIIKEVKFFVIALKYFFNTLPTLCKMCYTKLKYSNRSTAPEKVYRRWFEITRKDTGRKEKSNHHHR
ncbi:MAG: hypothetical protein SPL15_00550 [Lachnospiraceae bacterium]|nr:hypothetical protein [Lachnospiraceae bacterium]